MCVPRITGWETLFFLYCVTLGDEMVWRQKFLFHSQNFANELNTQQEKEFKGDNSDFAKFNMKNSCWTVIHQSLGTNSPFIGHFLSPFWPLKVIECKYYERESKNSTNMLLHLFFTFKSQQQDATRECNLAIRSNGEGCGYCEQAKYFFVFKCHLLKKCHF